MDCSEIEELAGALALRAVPADEAAAVREHLAGCPSEHRLLLELTETAMLLPLVVEDVAPPASLRSRLLAAALNDIPAADTTRDGALTVEPPAGTLLRPVALPPLSHEGTASSEPVPLHAGTRVIARAWWRSPAIRAAAAVLAVALAFGAWDVSLQSKLNDRTATSEQQGRVLAAIAAGARVTPLQSASGVVASLIQPSNGGAPYIVGQMPRLDAGKAYEAWIIRDGKPVAAGVFHSSGLAVMTLVGSPAGATAVAVTLEPAEGVVNPTGPVVLRAAVS